MDNKSPATTHERLAAFIEYVGITKNSFAKQIGTSSALISKLTTQDIDFRIDIIQKIVGKYPYLNIQWLLTGIGEMIVEKPNQKANQKQTENQTDNILNVFRRYKNVEQNFYENCNDNDIDKLLSNEIELLKDAFNKYYKLATSLTAIGAPPFIVEKFDQFESCKNFNSLKKRLDAEIKEDHPHVKLDKTLKIIQIEQYKEEIHHWNRALGEIIDYIEKYSGWFTGSKNPV